MILDVGCGQTPHGDVNCDLYIHDTLNHRDKECDTLNVKQIPNFIVCDALHLPFSNNSFTEVFCAQVIEHLEHPQQLIAELNRVVTYKITVETVNRYGERISVFLKPRRARWTREHHVSKFNFRWFINVSRQYHLTYVRGYILDWLYFPNNYCTIFRFPLAIGVILTK